MIVKRCFVSGRVQGVYFRASTRQEAMRLGVRGYAKNLSDGRVEVVAAGDASAVDALVRFLWSGSPLARVDAVVVSEFESVGGDAFPASFQTL